MTMFDEDVDSVHLASCIASGLSTPQGLDDGHSGDQGLPSGILGICDCLECSET